MVLKNKINYLLFVLFFFIFNLVPIYGKSGPNHAEDMLAVLGLFSENNHHSTNNNRFLTNEIFQSINMFIDSFSIYNDLKANFKYFDWGNYGHRIINHWGIDIDENISNTQYQDSLLHLFNAKIYNNYEEKEKRPLTDEIWITEWERFLIFIKDSQYSQNLALISIAKDSLGCDWNASRDITAILYYVHLLGDHIEHTGIITSEAVLELDKIKVNLDDHIKHLSKKCSWYYTDYVIEIKKLPRYNDDEYAQQILDVLKKFIPRILKSQYASEFYSKGLKFLYDE